MALTRNVTPEEWDRYIERKLLTHQILRILHNEGRKSGNEIENMLDPSARNSDIRHQLRVLLATNFIQLEESRYVSITEGGNRYLNLLDMLADL